MTQCFRFLKKIAVFLAQPLINVKNFIHMIILCLNLIFQTVTILVIVFHIYALFGMTYFNVEWGVHRGESKYNYCRQI